MGWWGRWRGHRPRGAYGAHAASLLPPRELPGPFWPANVLFARLHACAVVRDEPILVPDYSMCGVIEAALPPGPIVSMYKQTVSVEISGVE